MFVFSNFRAQGCTSFNFFRIFTGSGVYYFRNLLDIAVNVVSIHLALLIDSSRFLRMRILGSSDQKPTKNKQKRRQKSKFFEFFRTCPNTSERHPNASGQVRTGPNGSKQVRTGPNTSENMKKRSGTPKKSENFRKISRSRANFSDAALYAPNVPFSIHVGLQHPPQPQKSRFPIISQECPGRRPGESPVAPRGFPGVPRRVLPLKAIYTNSLSTASAAAMLSWSPR